MSRDTPVNQLRMTNVATVRITRGGKRFEIACYRNKCQDWRNNTEKDIREVLQSDEIFENVSSGILAKRKDLSKAFHTDDDLEIFRIILAEGTLEVGDLERHQQQDNLFRDIATIITTKCVNSETSLPFTETAIQNGLREIHFSIHSTKSAKQQALRAIPLLKAVMTIERAKIQLRLTFSRVVEASYRQLIVSKALVVLNSTEMQMDILIEPNLYREVNNLVVDHGRCEVLSLNGSLPSDGHDDDNEGDNDDDTKSSESHRPRPVHRDVVVFSDSYSNCRTCNESCQSQADFRSHCKSRWHNTNQKLKLKGLAVLTRSEFEGKSAAELNALLQENDDDN